MGFCSKHDNDIFAPLEKQTFCGTPEQCFLLGYRALTMELYKKHAAIKNLEVLRDTDKGKTPAEQFTIQTFTQYNEIGLRAGAEEADHYKSRYDCILESRDFNTVRGYIIEFEAPPPVMSSGSVFPEQDFDGVQLQDLGDLSNTPDLLCFASFYGRERGIVAFSWLSESDQSCCAFIQSLKSIPDKIVVGGLLRFLFTYCENVHINPDWWECLPQGTRDALLRRFADSSDALKERPNAVLVDDGVIYDPWEIVSRKSI